jgi:hypothetical protein
MHTTHVSSGGRYPVLRTVAILYLIAAVGVLALGIWRAVDVMVRGDAIGADVFGATTTVGGRAMVAASWLAATFIGVLAMFGVAELIKLFIDIEHNTRMAGMRMMPSEVVSTAPGTTTATTVVSTGGSDGAAPGGRIGQWLEGEETAEGALIRGH